MLHARISNKADLPFLDQSLVNRLLQEYASQQLAADEDVAGLCGTNQRHHSSRLMGSLLPPLTPWIGQAQCAPA